MDAPHPHGSRRSPGAEVAPAKRSRRSTSPSGTDHASGEGADRCRFTTPTPVEQGARAAERLEETSSGPVAGSQLEETSGTDEHLSGIMTADTNPPCWQ